MSGSLIGVVAQRLFENYVHIVRKNYPLLILKKNYLVLNMKMLQRYISLRVVKNAGDRDIRGRMVYG